MQNFTDIGLPKSLVESLELMKFTIPTPIQAKAIPVALAGNDILGSAQTGTGKTAAFAIPLINMIIREPNATALVLTPTRELATQVCEAIRQMTVKNCEAKTALLIGGDSMFKQLKQLQRRPRIIIGTPGRVNDHLSRKSLNLSQVKMFVLDETDRMLDMGFSVQIEQIKKFIIGKPQTLLFSATMPKNIMKLAERYLVNPVKIEAGVVNQVATKLNHQIMKVDEATKYNTLTEQLRTREGSVIVFVKTKHGADKLARKLFKENIGANAIHGDLKQRQRDKVIQDFRDSRFKVLVATDVASRGLDIPHIKHVINYDLPQKPEDFVHRIGRTARAGAEGEALSLILPSDGRMWRDISRLLNPDAKDEPRESRGHNIVKGQFHSKGNFNDKKGGGQGQGKKRKFGRNKNFSRSNNRAA